jgi:hypothetical protein
LWVSNKKSNNKSIGKVRLLLIKLLLLVEIFMCGTILMIF